MSRMQGQAPEDPLDNEEQLQEQLESLPYLCRFKCDTMSAYLCQSFDHALQRYSALGQGATPNSTIEMEVRTICCSNVYTLCAPSRGDGHWDR